MREISENHPRACAEALKDKAHGVRPLQRANESRPPWPELEWKRGKACIVSEIDDPGFLYGGDTDVGI